MIAPTKGDYVLLVFKTPIGCGVCPLNDPYNECCKASKKAYLPNTVKDRRPDFCPLKEMYSNESLTLPQGLCMYPMKDPGDCNSCLVNDFWGHCCRVTGTTYTYEQLHSGRRLSNCPMMDLYRDQAGSFKVM